MKEILIGLTKACFYIILLILTLCILKGFKIPEQIDIIGVLAVSAIVRHFVDTEQLKK